jgi:hypothetical protein
VHIGHVNFTNDDDDDDEVLTFSSSSSPEEEEKPTPILLDDVKNAFSFRDDKCFWVVFPTRFEIWFLFFYQEYTTKRPFRTMMMMTMSPWEALVLSFLRRF